MKRIRRFRLPFLPVHIPPPSERIVIALEKRIKGALFQCSMCGNCLLQETAFICPLLCPKGLRNGPCGSGSLEHCCVDPSRPCIWHVIYQRADRLGRLDRLLEVQAPLDWSRVGMETWVSVISKVREKSLLSPFTFISDKSRHERFKALFCELRQPDWWQGDDQYHPPVVPGPVSGLQAALKQGKFVVTAEVAPPAGAGSEKFQVKASHLRDLVHAANVTENPMATPRMSSLACCLLLLRRGIEPVLQLTARDCNRVSLQAEALGASALGIHNLLCLTGDAPTTGRGPAGGLPFDLDATQMLWILRRLRDEGRFLDGRLASEPPQLFLGAAASPNDSNPSYEALRQEKKINAGAQYLRPSSFSILMLFSAGSRLWITAICSVKSISWWESAPCAQRKWQDIYRNTYRILLCQSVS